MRALAACTVAGNVSVMMYRSTVLCRRAPGSDGGVDNYSSYRYSSWTDCTTRSVPAVHLIFYRVSLKSNLLIVIEYVNNVNKTEMIGGTWTDTNSYRDKKLSYRRGTARRAVLVKTMLNVANVCRIAFDKSCIRRMTFKVIQRHWKWHE